jgi:hypothetical protein
MSKILDFVTENSLGSALAATAIGTVIVWLWKCYKNWSDSKKIYNFLLSSKAGTEFTFRSTEAISSHTQIAESRVAELCSKHEKIRRNEKTKQSWQLIE